MVEIYFYADEFFLLNLLVNCWVYLLLTNIVRCSATYRTILLWSVIESFLATMCICLNFPLSITNICIHGIINPMGIFFVFRKEKSNRKLYIYIWMYVFVMMLGGISQFFAINRRLNIWNLLGVIIVSFFAIRFLLVIKKKDVINDEKSAYVKVYIEDICIEEVGLIDTGNSLIEPITKRPVSVIEETVVRDMNKYLSSRICVIPFNSIGKSGVLMGFRADKMEISYKENIYIENKPIVAISKNKVSVSGEYKIIINPLLIS